ncbi:MAG: peptidase domain-containing ABC transporter [Bacteroidota bacterium]
MRVPWLPTALYYDCGPACLAMILAWHGRESSVDDVRDRLGTSRDGTSGFELVRVARELGLSARGVKASGVEALAGVPLPAIAHYTTGHFVVLERVRAGRSGRPSSASGGSGTLSTAHGSVRVVDPVRGRLTRSFSDFAADFSGVLVLFEPTAEFRRERSRPWLEFLRNAVRGRGSVIARLAALSLALQGFAFVLPAAVTFVVDRVIPQRSLSALGLAALGIPVLVAVYALVAWVRGRAMAGLIRGVSGDLLDGIFRHLLRLPLTYFHGRPTEELVTRIQGADIVLDEILDQVAAAFLDALLAVTALVALLALYPGLAILVIGAAAVQGVLTVLAHRASLDEFIRDILSNSRLVGFTAEAIGGIADIKMIGPERVEGTWQRILDERLEARMRRKRRSAFWEGLLAAAQAGAQLAVLVGGAAMAIRGQGTVGAAVGFYALAGVCLAPVSALAASAYRLRSTSEYLRRAREILTARPEAADGNETPEATASAAAIRGAISLRNVSFRYAPTSAPVLHDVTLDVKPGEMVMIVGRTGSGKSTLARILATLHEPGAGSMTVDGSPVSEYSRTSLRTRIGCVFQENVLIGGSVYDNIALGRDLPIEQVYEALEAACLMRDVEAMPLLLATPVGANGFHLSGGQRQRLCLARAIASRPAVLILDEATSSVDRITEKRIYDNLDRLHATRILVTHRLYVGAYCDRIFVLDEGRIVESGTHDALLEREGPYAKLWTSKERATVT